MATILLAEDDDDLREVYARVLRMAGHDVVEAADGPTALERARDSGAQVLLLDLFLPGCDGLAVLERLRDDPGAVGLKVVVLSGHGEADARLESFALGAADYWIKGLGLDDLADRVARLLLPGEAGPR